jgi:hypothetical protein
MEDMDIDGLVESILGRAIGGAIKGPSLGGKRKPLQLPAGTKIAGEEAGGQWAPKGMGKVLAPSTPATRQGGPRGRKAAEIEQEKAVRRAITKGIGSPNAGAGRGGGPNPDADMGQTRAAIAKVASDMKRKEDEKPGDGSKKVVKAKPGGQASNIRGFNAMRSIMNGKLAGEDNEAATLVDAALSTVLNPNKGDMNPDAIRGAIKTANQNAMKRIAGMKGKTGAEKAALQAEVKKILAQVRGAMETDIKGRVRAQKAAKQAPGATGRPTKNGRAARSGKTGASVGQPRSAVGDARRDPEIPDTGGKRKAPVAKMINRGSQSVSKAERDGKKGIKPEPGISYTPRKKKKVKESAVSDILREYFNSRNL